MSLTRKVSSIVVMVFLLSALAVFFSQKFFIMPSFIALEKEAALKNAERVVGAIGREVEAIVPSVSDWSVWTDTYNFVKGDNPEYVEANLDESDTLDGMNMHYMGIYDVSGKAVWNQAYDHQAGESIDLGILTEKQLPVNHPLLQHTDLESVVKGIVSTTHGPLLVVSMPIITNDHQGPIAGTFVLGRLLGETAIEKISLLTKLPITIVATTKQVGSSVRARATDANYGLNYSDFKWVATPESWQLYTTIADIFGQPIVSLQVDTSLAITAQGRKAVMQSIVVLLLTGLLTMFIFWQLLQRAVLLPIERLSRHAMHIGENCDFAHVHFGPKRDDEIGVLAHSFDHMVDRLAETRRRLVDQSFKSGIAEMASGVLHNIGNAITPLNIRLSTLHQRCQNAPLAELKQVDSELADPTCSEERRADLLHFKQLAGDQLMSMATDSREEIEASLEQVQKIQEILNDQQRFSNSARVLEPIDISLVIADVEAEFGPELQSVLSIDVSPAVRELGTVTGTRAALQQLVANLLLNAAESIKKTTRSDGKLFVSACQSEWQGKPMMELCFTDNGKGIAPDNLTSLFDRGYSTKERKGSGYGLHWCANTIQSIGGLISAENNKDGPGACFKVLLPLSENLRPKSVQEGD